MQPAMVLHFYNQARMRGYPMFSNGIPALVKANTVSSPALFPLLREATINYRLGCLKAAFGA